MEIKIALTNLGKYNEGELVYKWLELPADDEELHEAFEDIGLFLYEDGVYYEEWFISDYEAPFEIEEHESLDKLNKIAEELELIEIPENRGYITKQYDAHEVINFAVDLENEGIVPSATEHTQDIIDDETLDEIVAQQASESGWQRVAFLIGGIDYMNDDFYWVNGYGNVENLDSDRLECIMIDLMDDVKREVQ